MKCVARQKKVGEEDSPTEPKKQTKNNILFAIVYQFGWIISLIYNCRNIHELT